MVRPVGICIDTTGRPPVVVLRRKAHPGGKDIGNARGERIDNLVTNRLITGATLVGIQTPTTRLLGPEYRAGVYPASPELAGAVTQVLAYRDAFVKEYYALRGKSGEAFAAFEPPCLVVAGHFGREVGNSRAKHSSFDLFRNSLQSVRVVTYDEVFDKVRALLELFEGG